MRWEKETGRILDAAFEVHTRLGPGLLESAYEHCLAYELAHSGLSVQRQVPITLNYKGLNLDDAYRIDLLVEDRIVVELKAVDRLDRLHSAQLLSYMKLAAKHVGFLINFNTTQLKSGIKRFVL